jgi:hypothetical protein
VYIYIQCTEVARHPRRTAIRIVVAAALPFVVILKIDVSTLPFSGPGFVSHRGYG